MSNVIEYKPIDFRGNYNLRKIERQAIIAVLRAYGGNRTVAAEVLGIGRATLYRKIKEYGVKKNEIT
jgi:DNA-binding NtrC family response regulator